MALVIRRGRSDEDEIEHTVGKHKKHKFSASNTSINIPDYSVVPATHMQVETELDRKAREKRKIQAVYAEKALKPSKTRVLNPEEILSSSVNLFQEPENKSDVHNSNNMAYYRKRKYRRSSCCGSSTRKRRRSVYPRAFPRSKYGATFVKRGTDENIALYGADYKSASGIQLANRRNTGFSGRGAYGVGKALRHGARHLIQKGLTEAKHLGGEMLHDAMSAGRAAFDASPEGQAFNAIYGAVGGRGAYEVTSNQLINPMGPSSAMTTSPDETNDITLSRSEFIQDITSDSTKPFNTVFNAALNPGLPGPFPWLSQIAQYFEEYEFVQLIFEVRSMVTEGNTTAGGTIVHATQYNPTNALFTTKQRMENYEYASSHKVTDHGQHGIECDPAKRAGSAAEYVRTGPVPSGQDQKSYDLALYQLVITGATANINIGELWVHYTVKLKKTKIPDPGSAVTPFAQCSANSTQTGVNNIGSSPFVIAASSTIVPTISGQGTPNLQVALPASMTAALKYDIALSCDGLTTAGVSRPLLFTMTATNATVNGDDNPTCPTLGGTFALATIQNGSCVKNFTPNGGGQVVLTLSATLGAFPSSGTVFLTINPSSTF